MLNRKVLITRKFPTTIAVVLTLLVLGTFLRLYHFDTIPYGINHDGAMGVIEGINLKQQPLPYLPYSLRNPWLGESFFYYLIAAVLVFLPPTVTTAKLVTTIFSLALLPVLFLLTKQLFDKRVATLALLALTVSGWHITMGKSVWRVITLPFFETLTLYFFFLALKSKRLVWALLGGLSLAFTINSYNAGRIFPAVILLAGWFYARNKKKPLRTYFRPFGAFLIAAGVGLAPLAAFAIKHWEAFNSRFAAISVFRRIAEDQNFSPLWLNLKKTLLMFTVKAGGDDFFVREPLIDWPFSWFFWLGVIFAVLNWRKFPFKIVLIGFLLNLLPGLLSQPNGNHNIGALPFIFILCGLGLSWVGKTAASLATRLKQQSLALYLPAFIYLVTAALAVTVTFHLYLGKNRRELWGFYPETTAVANFMRGRLDSYAFYLTNNFPRDPLVLLTYDGISPSPLQKYVWLENANAFFTVEKPVNKGLVFVMLPGSYNEIYLKGLEAKFPSGERQLLTYQDDRGDHPAAWLFIVN